MLGPADSQTGRIGRESAVITPMEITLERAVSTPDPDAEKRARVARRLGQRRDQKVSGRPRIWRSRIVAWLVWLYAAGVLVAWGLLLGGGDRWWFPTVMLYSPRWIYALPLIVLVPTALLWRRRMLWVLTAVALIVGGPIMGFCAPWTGWAASDESTIRTLTCNVQTDHVDREALARLIEETRPDIVALQECDPDYRPTWPPGWHTYRAGGLLLASRYPIRNVQIRLLRHPPQRWPRVSAIYGILETPQRPVHFCNLHLRSPRWGLMEVLDRRSVVDASRSPALLAEIDYRRREAQEIKEWIDGLSPSVVIAGDFNMPTDSTIYRDTWAAYANAFSQVGWGFGYTKWSPLFGFHYGSRIDHVLTGAGWRAVNCRVGPEVSSDHRPLIADLSWTGPSDAP